MVCTFISQTNQDVGLDTPIITLLSESYVRVYVYYNESSAVLPAALNVCKTCIPSESQM